MYCILGYLVLVIAQFFVPPALGLFLALAGFAVSITAAVFVFMLALSLYGTGVGIVLGILTLVPLVGLIVLLVINGKATTVLRHHGIRVGLMGADPARSPRQGRCKSRCGRWRWRGLERFGLQSGTRTLRQSGRGDERAPPRMPRHVMHKRYRPSSTLTGFPGSVRKSTSSRAVRVGLGLRDTRCTWPGRSYQQSPRR
jgi:hypothetical protein